MKAEGQVATLFNECLARNLGALFLSASWIMLVDKRSAFVLEILLFGLSYCGIKFFLQEEEEEEQITILLLANFVLCQ